MNGNIQMGSIQPSGTLENMASSYIADPIILGLEVGGLAVEHQWWNLQYVENQGKLPHTLLTMPVPLKIWNVLTIYIPVIILCWIQPVFSLNLTEFLY